MPRERADSLSDRVRQNGASLAYKLNLIIVIAILLVAVGLVKIGYSAHSQRIDEIYFQQLENVSEYGVYFVDPKGLAFFWEQISSDDFADMRKRAVAAGDDQVIIDWMKGIDASHLNRETGADEARNTRQHLSSYYDNLYDVYEDYISLLDSLRKSSGVTSAYLQFMVDGVTYDLIDPDLTLFDVGTIEAALPEFSDYGDNELVPPTIYKSKFGWLCTTCSPIYDQDTDKAVAMLCFDADMTQTMHERYRFLMRTAIYVLMVTLFVMVVSLYLVRRLVTNPIRKLSDATCRFCEDNEDLSENKPIELDIRSNDEIGVLYHEIRSMQDRIVDYTQHMALISAEKEHVRTELDMANAIQVSMLPSIFPAFPDRQDFDVYASMDPAKEVGGDFYDFFLIDEDHLALVIADVSGKGVPAALFMMATMIMINDRAMAGGTPAEILSSVNLKIRENNKTLTFVTVWMGILDIRTGTLTCSNAGHGFPWVRGADGTFQMLRDKHGLVLGGSKRVRYVDYAIDLSPGDAIFVHTDGVNEATNREGKLFGTERLGVALNSCEGAGPQDVLRAVRASVDAFVDGAEQFDDLTMLCMEYRGYSVEADTTQTTSAFPDVDGGQDSV